MCSKRLAPTWEELGKALEGEDGVEVATVDCTTNKATCGKADIRSYPTLKLFLNGEEYKKYSGMVPLACSCASLYVCVCVVLVFSILLGQLNLHTKGSISALLVHIDEISWSGLLIGCISVLHYWSVSLFWLLDMFGHLGYGQVLVIWSP